MRTEFLVGTGPKSLHYHTFYIIFFTRLNRDEKFPAIPLDTMQPKITGQFDCGYGEDELIFEL